MKRKRGRRQNVDVTPAPTNPRPRGRPKIDPDKLLIEERKEEKRKALKEKLQQKVKIIRDRRVSGVTNEEFPEGAFERLASHKIWEVVFGYITDPMDVTNACNTCKKFVEILDERRTLMVMPKMLETVKASAPPEVSKPISLGTRVVSKAWKDVANFCLFDSDLAKEDWFQMPEMPSPSDSKWRMSACVFDDERSVDRATSVLSGQGQPPSFSIRTVMVILNERGATEEFQSKVVEFLQKHGNSVWFFSFQISMGYTENFGGTFEILHSMLQCLPNLKGLVILDSMSAVRTATEVEDFQRRLSEQRLPPLDFLVHFGCHWSDDYLLSHVSQKCKNLKSLMFKTELAADVSIFTAEALRGLTLERFNGSTFIIPPMCIARFFKCSWPLKHFTIDMRHSAIAMDVKASEVFSFLNGFWGTLKVFEILGVKILRDFDTWSMITPPNLNLPGLTTLCLESFGRGCGSLGFDDLLSLKSLEQLHVGTNISQEEFVEYLGEDAKSKVKVAKYLKNGEMEKSNIWGWFPNLMNVEMSRNNVFHRPNEH